jgi:ornithine--oxo-acid transaminase
MNSLITKELKHACNNYSTIPKLMVRGKGIYVYDKMNHSYIDCISGYSALNQGHCHDRLIQVMQEQCKMLTLTSRAYHNDQLGNFSEKLCKQFNYDKVLLMNGGVESGESAIKIARAWGYKVKNIPINQALNVFFNNNFWGRSISACSSSSDPSCYHNFGPYTEGFHLLDYNNIDVLEDFLSRFPNVVSIMLEPIQGEGGIIIPDSGYLTQVKSLCHKYNVLMIADEVQTGLGRTGKMLACDHENIKPDILCLGKALSGGFYPLSATLANKDIMDVITPGTHGSTFGGNPLACAIGSEALDIILDEKLIENSENMGKLFRSNIHHSSLKDVRGKGLLNGLEFDNKKVTNHFISHLLESRVFSKSTRETTVRITPPLVITEYEMNILIEKIQNALNKL